MDRQRILEKIQKCLNMSKDARGNADECATALRQAQKLMDKYGVSKAELSAIGFAKETVHTSVQVNMKSVPVRVNNLAVIIQKAFGVKATIYATKRVSDWSYSIDYYGPQDRVIMAAYAHTVVQRGLDAAYKEQLAKFPYLKGVRGGRVSFEIGWLAAVAAKIAALVITEDEQDGIDELLAKDGLADIEEVKTRKQTLYSELVQDGVAAAGDFSLHRPVGTEPLKIEK
jgi:hypothetical protein